MHQTIITELPLAIFDVLFVNNSLICSSYSMSNLFLQKTWIKPLNSDNYFFDPCEFFEA